MIYLAAVLGIFGTLFFYLKYHTLCKAIRRADKELSDITTEVEDNRILKQEYPCRPAAEFFVTINEMLKAVRQERVAFERWEQEFRKQIEGLSHDLRTPLTSVSGYLKLMDREDLSPENRENLEVALRKTAALQRLITQFYDYSRFSARDYALEVENVDIARVLRECIVDYYQEFAEKNLDIEIQIPDRPVCVTASQEALERIFLNLIQNCLRYAQCAVKIGLTENGNVFFRNDAEGMGEEEAQRLFERFYVRDAARSQGSTGLGLATARALAEKMGASLKAEVTGMQELEVTLLFSGS